MRAAVFHQGVEERVGGGVVALARGADRARDGGEHHERVEVRRQLVQVPGSVGLGAQHRADAVGRQRLDGAVVEDARGVHDGTDFVARQQRFQRRAVGDVARLDDHVGAQRFQLRDVGLAAARDEQEVADAVRGDEVAGDHEAEAAGAAGDENPALPGELGGRGQAGQARHEGLAVAQADLRLVQREDLRRDVAVGLDQHETAGVLGLRRPHQAPHGRGAQVTGTGDEREAVLAFVGEPLLEALQDLRGQGMRGLDRRAGGHDVLHHGFGGLGGQRDGRPVHVEQRLARDARVGGDRARDERVD
ncbi:hypothetical protein GCM10010178_24890 [Lentzea flava]|uniref:Uncharacterized protein n=1 Tax=Lentzea flava TaxID=103732 RepID=A0ABQ2UG31_9PSEU|nr:hypothetical protein GCM10010178_24890 [Lentzea flava]